MILLPPTATSLATDANSEWTVLIVATFALALAVLHVLVPGLVVFESLPRSPMLSFGAGVSVSYVFVHLLPEVSRTSATFAGDPSVPFEAPIFGLALGGFVLFYGLELLARRSKYPSDDPVNDDPTTIFWLHVGSFAVYNALLGYLIAERVVRQTPNVVIYAVAIGLHFLVNDHNLRERYEQLYHDIGRWLLAATVVIGAGVGLVVELDSFHLDLLVSVLAGAIVFNVIREELPSDREERFSAFISGIVVYTVLLTAA